MQVVDLSCSISRLLSCGFHHCKRLCHGDSCGPCHAVCGKSRKLWYAPLHPASGSPTNYWCSTSLPSNHACILPCHAPAACDESEPCRNPITLTCPCGRIHQQVPCRRSTSNPAGLEGSQPLKCSNECLMAKRNARLAEALGINTEARSNLATYADDLLSNAKSDAKFCLLVEKTFATYVALPITVVHDA